MSRVNVSLRIKVRFSFIGANLCIAVVPPKVQWSQFPYSRYSIHLLACYWKRISDSGYLAHFLLDRNEIWQH